MAKQQKTKLKINGLVNEESFQRCRFCAEVRFICFLYFFCHFLSGRSCFRTIINDGKKAVCACIACVSERTHRHK